MGIDRNMISIAVPIQAPSAAVVSAIRAVTGASIDAIARAVESGEPIYKCVLSDRPREKTFADIRQLVADLGRLGVSLRIAENGSTISSEVLLNILRSSEQDAEQLRQLDDLGHS